MRASPKSKLAPNKRPLLTSKVCFAVAFVFFTLFSTGVAGLGIGFLFPITTVQNLQSEINYNFIILQCFIID